MSITVFYHAMSLTVMLIQMYKITYNDMNMPCILGQGNTYKFRQNIIVQLLLTDSVK
jgi:hypothetical protein